MINTAITVSNSANHEDATTKGANDTPNKKYNTHKKNKLITKHIPYVNTTTRIVNTVSDIFI